MTHVQEEGHSLEAGPVVGPHLQEAANDHAQPDAAAIAQQDVQDDLIPPALGEIGQQVHEEKLRKQDTMVLKTTPQKDGFPWNNILLGRVVDKKKKGRVVDVSGFPNV